MIRNLILCALSLGTAIFLAQNSAAENLDNTSNDPLGHYRLLVMCIPEASVSANNQFQKAYFKINWDEFAERDLVLVHSQSATTYTLYGLPINKQTPFGMTVDWNRTQHINNNVSNRARCADRFETVLIGKDTGVKKRWDAFPLQQDIFNIIDAMPMRRYEMKTREGQK